MNPIEIPIQGYRKKYPKHAEAIDRIVESWRSPDGQLPNDDRILADIRQLFKKRKRHHTARRSFR